ncbi:MAG: prepilin peptidase [Treponema sp.]|jgi:prepilin signal peptidase PulO-like enzyme (type II secretory pathway)|nr:prepilin peptidase [Treponema sp.]
MINTFSMALFYAFSMVIALADIEEEEVPRVVFAAAFPVFFALRVGWGLFPVQEAAAGLLVGLGFFLLARLVSRGKLGLADVWYSALIGMVLGPRRWYGAICLACAGALILLLASGKRRVPFIPFMAAGSIAISILQGW